MDRKLLDLLCSPDTRQPLALLEARGLDALNRAIAAGQVLRGDGSAQAQPLREALVSRDRKQVFRIDDGIPVLLVEEALATAQAGGFPAAGAALQRLPKQSSPATLPARWPRISAAAIAWFSASRPAGSSSASGWRVAGQTRMSSSLRSIDGAGRGRDR